MTRPTILDLDLVVVPREATDEMRHANTGQVFFFHAYSAMLSASPYPTAWDDVRKYVEGLEEELKWLRDNSVLMPIFNSAANRAEAAEARIAELEADHLEERLAMSGRIQFLEDASAVPHLEHRIAELEAALDEKEVADGLTSNGNLWRFWSTKASALAVRIAELEKRLADAERVISKQRDALRPISDAVFNDNGDITVNLSMPTGEEFIAAYFADRAARAYMEGK